MHIIIKLTLVMMDNSFFYSFSDEVLNERLEKTLARLLAMPFAFRFKIRTTFTYFFVTDVSGSGTPFGM